MENPLPATTPDPKKRFCVLRRCLIALAVCVTVIGLFYTEELWRGKSAWDDCRRELEADGIDFNWEDHIPASVPDNQNVFGVPEMQKWFTGRGATELSKRIQYPGLGQTNRAQLVIAKLKIELPGTSSQNGSNVLHWGDPQAQEQATQLIQDAIGPVAVHPANFLFTLQPPEEIQPAQIVLDCQTAPTTQDLLKFLPTVSAITADTDPEELQLQAVAGGYDVSIQRPDSVAEFLKWSDQLAPQRSLIGAALERPYMRMNADYSSPPDMAIPNFVTVRAFAQYLSAAARCHLLANKPDDALADLTLLNNLSRIYTNQPITLVGAMVNAAVAGLYASTISDGVRWHAWGEPQCAALEQQLQEINLLAPVEESLGMESVSMARTLELMPVSDVFAFNFKAPGHATTLGEHATAFFSKLIPQGWVYQNMAIIAKAEHKTLADIDPTNETVYADHANAAFKEIKELISRRSPYTFLAALWIPNSLKAAQRVANNQTSVNLTLIACALERFRIARGAYPENLSELVQQFISSVPHDLVGGQPPHYHRTADGKFILYSVGWSGQDQGGIRGKADDQGDWVWPE